MLTRLLHVRSSRAHTHASTRLPAAETRAVDEQALLPPGALLSILHALIAARSVALSFTHTQMPTGGCSGRVIPQRTNDGMLALLRACSSAALLIALESMHTQRNLGDYALVHANATRECSCQAGPRHKKIRNANPRPPGVKGRPLITSLSATRGSSFRSTYAQTARAPTRCTAARSVARWPVHGLWTSKLYCWSVSCFRFLMI